MSVIFIGSYTEMIVPGFGGKGEGISTLKLNETSGELQLLGITRTTNPGYLTLGKDGDYLYAIKEVVSQKKPSVKAYKISTSYELEFLNEQSIPGGLPCHIACKNNAVLISCYETGNILSYPVDSVGKLLNFAHHFTHIGSSINKERQEGPHPHQIVVNDQGTYVFVPDLGIDKIKVYELNETILRPLDALDIDIPKGSGPRHLVFRNDGQIGYLMNELTGTISIIKKNKKAFKFIKDVSSLPKSFIETPSASAIRIHPSKPLLYAANRTLDAITIFKTIDDSLECVDYHYTNGKTLREFTISPNGKWLIACLQDSNEIVVYRIQPNGKLTENYRTTEIASPVCAVFHEKKSV